jgi:hypothetical protein
MDYKFELNAKSKILLGFQTIYQSALNFGGNEDPKPILKKMVIPKPLVEVRLAKQRGRSYFNYNATKGRYLM